MVRGTVGRRSAFEVVVAGQLVHSKLATRSFPDTSEVVAIVREVAGGGGGEPRRVVRTVKTCTIH